MWLRGVFFLYFDCIARHLKREEKDRQETKLRDKIDRSSWQMTEWLVGDVIPLFHIFSKLFHERFLIGISSNSISPQSIISHNRNRRSSSRSHARTSAIGIILMLIEIEYVCLFNSDTCDVCATARAFAFVSAEPTPTGFLFYRRTHFIFYYSTTYLKIENTPQRRPCMWCDVCECWAIGLAAVLFTVKSIKMCFKSIYFREKTTIRFSFFHLRSRARCLPESKIAASFSNLRFIGESISKIISGETHTIQWNGVCLLSIDIQYFTRAFSTNRMNNSIKCAAQRTMFVWKWHFIWIGLPLNSK